MAIYDFTHVSIHDFKSNISRYIRMLERGEVRAVIVCRHATPVGLFTRIAPERAEELMMMERE